MRITLKLVVSSLILIILNGCMSKTTTIEYYKVDITDKSITVPAGGDQVFSFIKQGLINDGWDLQINDSSLLTVKSNKSETTNIQYNTKYKLLMTIKYWGSSISAYNVSVINNLNGKEVMTIFKPPMGTEEPEVVAEKVLNWFRNN